MEQLDTHQRKPSRQSAFSASKESGYVEQEKGAAQRIVEEAEANPNSMSPEKYLAAKDKVARLKRKEAKLAESTPSLTEIDSVGGVLDFAGGIAGGLLGTYGSYASNLGDVYQNKKNAMIADIPEDERTPEAKDHASNMAIASLALDTPLAGGVAGALAKGTGKAVIKGVIKDMAEDVLTNSAQSMAEQSGRGQDVDLGSVAEAGASGLLGGTMARVPAKAIGHVKNKVFEAAKDPNSSTAQVVESVRTGIDNVYGRRFATQERAFKRDGNVAGMKLHKDLREEMDILRKTEMGRGSELLKETNSLFKRKDQQNFIDALSGKKDFSEFSPEQQKNIMEVRQLLDEEFNRGVTEGHGKLKDVQQTNKDGSLKFTKKGKPMMKKQRVLEKVDNYVPLTPDAKILKANRLDAIADLVAEGKYNQKQATKVIDVYLADNKQGHVPNSRSVVKQLLAGHLPKKGAGKPKSNSNLDQSRMIEASQEWQSKYSNGDLIGGLKEWNKRRAHSVALDTFVGIDGAKLAQRLGEVAKASKEPLDTKYFSDVANAVDLYDRGVGANLAQGNRLALSTAKSMANFAYLPLTALSSLTETFNLATKVGVVPWAMAQGKMIGSVAQNMMGHAFKGVPKPELHKQTALAGRAWDTSVDQLSSRLGESTTGNFSKGMESFNDKFFKLTMQSPINYMNNIAAVHAMQAQIKNDINVIGKENATERYKNAAKRLEELGIDIKDPSVVSAFKTRSGDAYNQMMPSVINRFTRDIVLNPTTFDKPAWSSTGWMSMFSQLQGYPMMWASQVFPRMMANASGKDKSLGQNFKDKANLAMTMSAMVLVSYLQESMKAEIRGQDKSEDELVFLAWSRAAAPYQVGNMLNAIQGKSGGLQGMMFGTPAVNILDDINTNLRNLMEGNLSPDNAVFAKQFKGLY